MSASIHDDSDFVTHGARAAILKHAEMIFPLLSRHREGREELRRHREIATSRLDHPDPAEAQWAMLMLWKIDGVLELAERKAPSVPTGMVLVDRSELERIANLAALGGALALTDAPDASIEILRADNREAGYRFARIAKLASALLRPRGRR